MNGPLIPDTLTDALKPVTVENKFRAQQALNALRSHALHTRVVDPFDGAITETDIIDLLSNIMHACEQAGYNYNEINATATGHFESEAWEDNQ